MKPFWGQLSPHTMMCVCLLTPTLSDPMDRSLPGSFVHAIIQARIIQWCLAWKIPWMEEPGRLWSMGLLRVGHAWVASLSLFTFTHWRRKWQPAPVFLPGESQGRGAWWAAIYGITQSRTRLSDLAAAVLIKRGYLDTDMYIGRMPCEDKGRDRGDASISQGEKPGFSHGSFPHALRRNEHFQHLPASRMMRQ